jgi:hypothetical protein
MAILVFAVVRQLGQATQHRISQLGTQRRPASGAHERACALDARRRSRRPAAPSDRALSHELDRADAVVQRVCSWRQQDRQVGRQSICAGSLCKLLQHEQRTPPDVTGLVPHSLCQHLHELRLRGACCELVHEQQTHTTDREVPDLGAGVSSQATDARHQPPCCAAEQPRWHRCSDGAQRGGPVESGLSIGSARLSRGDTQLSAVVVHLLTCTRDKRTDSSVLTSLSNSGAGRNEAAAPSAVHRAENASSLCG